MGKEFKKRNDYTCVTFQFSGEGKKPDIKTNIMRFVHDLKYYSNWLDKKGIKWNYFNVYSRRGERYLGRFYKNEIIPKKIDQGRGLDRG